MQLKSSRNKIPDDAELKLPSLPDWLTSVWLQVDLSMDDIETILNTLIYDGKVEMTVIAAKEGTVGSVDGQMKLYRGVNPVIQPTGLVRTPCGLCPVTYKKHKNSLKGPWWSPDVLFSVLRCLTTVTKEEKSLRPTASTWRSGWTSDSCWSLSALFSVMKPSVYFSGGLRPVLLIFYLSQSLIKVEINVNCVAGLFDAVEWSVRSCCWWQRVEKLLEETVEDSFGLRGSDKLLRPADLDWDYCRLVEGNIWGTCEPSDQEADLEGSGGPCPSLWWRPPSGESHPWLGSWDVEDSELSVAKYPRMHFTSTRGGSRREPLNCYCVANFTFTVQVFVFLLLI